MPSGRSDAMEPASDAGVEDGGADAEAGGGCAPMTFGASCTPVTCQHGTCSEGACWGPLGDGTCNACDTGWAGESCDDCDATHYGASCEATITCQNGTCGAGTCSGMTGGGTCDGCNTGAIGDDCDQCDAGHFGVNCLPVTCQNGSCSAGTCSGSSGDGHCDSDSCDDRWAGDDCDMCGSGSFGETCEPVTCENGTCNPGTCSGLAGNGQCDACADGWVGPNCAQICKPFDIEACYDGPDGTMDVGICRAGMRVCHQSGHDWSPCMDQVTPRAEDICGNGLDDNCSGSDADEVCGSSAVAVWVDAETGSDAMGDGSYTAPFATLNRGMQTGRRLIIVVADGDGTVYEEDIALSSSHRGITFWGWGPMRPTLVGTVSLTHCYDCTFENMELSYPDVADYDPNPVATVRGIHNYRSVWRNIRFSAPLGLPAGANLYSTHHGYDNLFNDVEIDDVVLAPGAGNASYTYALLNASDHGSGSQFIRVTLGSIGLSGEVPQTLNLELIKAWGYCDQQPDAVTAVRNAVIAGLDMSGMATTTTRFRAIDIGCYYTFEEPAGFMVLNNTFADITATSVTFAALDLRQDMQTWISGNIVGPHTATTVIGLESNRAATIDHSDFYGVTTPTSGMAALGSNMLDVDPGFVGGGDYRLDMGSACIDTGDPQLTDGDGTPSDMGAFGGPLSP